jgi:hypothetical protein
MTLHTVRWEADQADEVLGNADVQVTAIVAVHGAHVLWRRVTVSGVTVAPANGPPDLLRALPLGPVGRADRLAGGSGRLRFRSAA